MSSVASGCQRSPARGAASRAHVEPGETDNDIRVIAELPGLDAKNVGISLEGSALTLRGEKRSEVEDKVRGYSEGCYGVFTRTRSDIGLVVEEGVTEQDDMTHGHLREDKVAAPKRNWRQLAPDMQRAAPRGAALPLSADRGGPSGADRPRNGGRAH
jgi:hypothetical protein